MAFAVTKFKAFGIRACGSTRSHARQVVEMNITAANTNITYDLGTTAGTFWTSAVADTTYGTLATAARTVLLTGIAGALNQFLVAHSETLYAYSRVASGASGAQYTVSVASSMPTFTFVSGSAPTSWKLVLEWSLADGQEAVVADLG